MSIIQTLTYQNASLKAEIAKLTAEKSQIEQDIAFVASTTKKAWNSLGLDLKKEADSNTSTSSKLSMMEITRFSLKIGKKLMTKEISISNLIEKWEQMSPILQKYQHLLKDNPTNDERN